MYLSKSDKTFRVPVVKKRLIGQKLTALRQESKLTFDRARKILKINYSLYNDFENGEKVPEFKPLNRLLKIHKISADYLILDKDNNDENINSTRVKKAIGKGVLNLGNKEFSMLLSVLKGMNKNG